jgi:hypothetical protein
MLDTAQPQPAAHKRQKTSKTTASKKTAPSAVAPHKKLSYHLNLAKALIHVEADHSLHEMTHLKPSAFIGLEQEAETLLRDLRVFNIEELGAWRYYKTAKAILRLKDIEKGKRVLPTEGEVHEEEKSNNALSINGAVKREYWNKSLHELVHAPVDAMRGFPQWAVHRFANIKHPVKTIEDLANWKFCIWAESISDLARFEDFNDFVAEFEGSTTSTPNEHGEETAQPTETVVPPAPVPSE